MKETIIEEQISLHHLVTVIEGRIVDGYRPIAMGIENGMYFVVFEKVEK